MPEADPRLDEIYRRGDALRSRRRRIVGASGGVVAVAMLVAGLAVWSTDGDDEGSVAVVDERTTTSESTATTESTPTTEPAPTTTTTTAAATTTTVPAPRTLEVSDRAVGETPFGAPAPEAIDRVRAVLGEPSSDTGWMRWFSPEEMDPPIEPSDGAYSEGVFYQDRIDNLGFQARYPLVREVCWDRFFCVHLGGESEADASLRGWALASTMDLTPPDPSSMRVRMTTGGLTLGSTWAEVQAAFPSAFAMASEARSIAIDGLPFPTIYSGQGGWMLSGQTPPHPAPADPGPEAQLIRLSAGQGHEPGCC